MTFISTSSHNLISYVVKMSSSSYVLILVAVQIVITFVAMHKYCTCALV